MSASLFGLDGIDVSDFTTGPFTFYVESALGVTSATELDGATISLVANSAMQTAVDEFFRSQSISYEPVPVTSAAEAVAQFQTGASDVLVSPSSAQVNSRQLMTEGYVQLPFGAEPQVSMLKSIFLVTIFESKDLDVSDDVVAILPPVTESDLTIADLAPAADVFEITEQGIFAALVSGLADHIGVSSQSERDRIADVLDSLEFKPFVYEMTSSGALIDIGPGPIVGTPDDDALSGTVGNDIIEGLAGNDRLSGLAGIDEISGGKGRDRLFGGADVDMLNGDRGRDVLKGGAGDDALSGGGGRDKLFGQDGTDLLKGGQGRDKLFGGTGIDTLEGGRSGDTLLGGDGGDKLSGGGGNDILRGGASDQDPSRGGLLSRDVMDGGSGNDLLFGDEGDEMTGGSGADVFKFRGALRDNVSITDFEQGKDKIDMTQTSVESFAELEIIYSRTPGVDPEPDVWGPAVVALPDIAATIFLTRLVSELTADDFIF